LESCPVEETKTLWIKLFVEIRFEPRGAIEKEGGQNLILEKKKIGDGEQGEKREKMHSKLSNTLVDVTRKLELARKPKSNEFRT